MSLYGNVKKVASSTFQFDKIYPNRVEMEAHCKSDGVYAGRYILVEYGQKYVKQEVYETQYDENNEPHSVLVARVTDNEEYVNNYNADIREYGTVYDSTVWQKIYSFGESGEKYVMVAELNALAPKLNLKHIDPLKYSYQEGADEPIYVLGETNGAPDLKKLNNVIEEKVNSSFDTVVANELQYDLNLPEPLQLNVDNHTINYNKEGFDVVYSIPLDNNDKNSYIGWVPDGLTEDEVDEPGETETVSSKSLLINLPTFGNTVKALYDLIYGKPGENEQVRPYFKRYWEQARDRADLPEGENLGYEKDETTGEWNSNDNERWLSEVPDIGQILANQEEGLAGILGKLFVDRDPISGTVKFYLQSDWANYNYFDKEASEITNAPMIDNKPQVVGYKRIEYDENNEPVAQYSECDYYIDFKGWSLNYLGRTALGEEESQEENQEETEENNGENP